MPKARHPIEESEISRIFDDACIKGLATTRLLAGADLRRFAEGVREGARIYARDARVPTNNELHAEIAALYRAAERKQYEQVAALLEGFSPKARGLLNGRGARPSLGLELPAANALRDAAQQKKARETVLRLCRLGGEYVEGRRRSSGKRSRTWRPLLHTPRPSRSFPKRDAERNFVMQLQLAWLEATGRPPSLAANPARPGPFVRTVRKCLELVGASHADAVGLINELNRRRKRKTGVPSQPVRYQN